MSYITSHVYLLTSHIDKWAITIILLVYLLLSGVVSQFTACIEKEFLRHPPGITKAVIQQGEGSRSTLQVQRDTCRMSFNASASSCTLKLWRNMTFRGPLSVYLLS